jgi:hypothetical protein
VGATKRAARKSNAIIMNPTRGRPFRALITEIGNRNHQVWVWVWGARSMANDTRCFAASIVLRTARPKSM